MIKVNLLRSQQQQSTEEYSGGATQVAGALGPTKEEQVEVIKKFGIMMSKVLLLQ